MCGGSPSSPTIVYSGPSGDDIARNEQALAQYQSQMQEQQSAFQSQLQAQIDKANQETADLEKRYQNEASAAAAAAAGQQTQAYAINAAQSEAPEAAQTTAAIAKKKKPRSNLRISRAALPASEGSGLNIGV
jgi:outer membrane translocation and assembly module TamA